MDPAPNQMNDGYEAADAMLEMEYEDRNGCAYTEEETQDITSDVEPGADMDGDATSALASAGFGTDEDYEHNLYDDNGME